MEIVRASLMKEILNISNENIIQLEIPTGNPLLNKFDTNLKLKKIKYLDKKRKKNNILNFNFF